MKSLRHIFKGLIVMSIFLCSACVDEQSNLIPNTGTVVFNYENPYGETSQTIASVVFSIANSKGEFMYNAEVSDLYKIGGSSLTKELELDPGEYTLESFFAIDSNNNVISISPANGSRYATTTINSLPISFSVVASNSSPISVAVFDVAQYDSIYNDFGYIATSVNNDNLLAKIDISGKWLMTTISPISNDIQTELIYIEQYGNALELYNEKKEFISSGFLQNGKIQLKENSTLHFYSLVVENKNTLRDGAVVCLSCPFTQLHRIEKDDNICFSVETPHEDFTVGQLSLTIFADDSILVYNGDIDFGITNIEMKALAHEAYSIHFAGSKMSCIWTAQITTDKINDYGCTLERANTPFPLKFCSEK